MRRNPHRAAGVRAERSVAAAGGDESRRTARRAARHTVEVPGIEHIAPCRIETGRFVGEFGHLSSADKDRAGVRKTGNHRSRRSVRHWRPGATPTWIALARGDHVFGDVGHAGEHAVVRSDRRTDIQQRHASLDRSAPDESGTPAPRRHDRAPKAKTNPESGRARSWRPQPSRRVRWSSASSEGDKHGPLASCKR